MSSTVESSNSAGVSPSEPSNSVSVGRALAAWAIGWVLGSVVLASLVFIYVADASEGAGSTVVLALAAAVGWAALIGSLVVVARGAGVNMRAIYGVSARWTDVLAIPAGIVAQLALVPLVYVPLRIVAPTVFDGDALEQTARELVDAATGWRIALLLAVVVVGAPCVEELTYRGLLQRSFVARFGPTVGLVIAATFFALIHLRPVEFPGLLVAGLVFGGFAVRTGRLGGAVLAHAAFNATGILMLLV